MTRTGHGILLCAVILTIPLLAVILSPFRFGAGLTQQLDAEERTALAHARRCKSNLIVIEWAKAELAYRDRLEFETSITWRSLTNYPGINTTMECPCGGTYSVNPLGVPASCSHTGVAWLVSSNRDNAGCTRGYEKEPYYHKLDTPILREWREMPTGGVGTLVPITEADTEGTGVSVGNGDEFSNSPVSSASGSGRKK